MRILSRFFVWKLCFYIRFARVCHSCGFCHVFSSEIYFSRILLGFSHLKGICCDHYVIICFHATLLVDFPSTCYMFNTSPPKERTHAHKWFKRGGKFVTCTSPVPNTEEENVIWLAAGTWDVENLHKYETSPRLFTFSGLTIWELFLDSIGDGAWSILFGFCLVNSAILLGGVYLKIKEMYWYILTPPRNRVTKGVVMVLGYIRSLLKPAPKTPHASLGTGMPKAPWHCFHFLRPLRLKWLLTPQLRFFVMWNKARKPHWLK